MAASAKDLTVESCNLTGGWTVVLPRRKRQRRNLKHCRTFELKQEPKQEPWVPVDLPIDPIQELKLMQKIDSCITKMKNSQFFSNILHQIQTPPISDYFDKVLGNGSKMQMVIYGIGSIGSYSPPRLQLSLAILLKRHLSWIGDIEVFDPVLSVTESRVLETLGCSVLPINEYGRRRVQKPTMFFMPHCEAELYNNLLQANWEVNLLIRMVIFGNSFEIYEHHVSEFKNSIIGDSTSHILAVRRCKKEFRLLTISDDYFNAFHDSSWHFFSPVQQRELQVTVL